MTSLLFEKHRNQQFCTKTTMVHHSISVDEFIQIISNMIHKHNVTKNLSVSNIIEYLTVCESWWQMSRQIRLINAKKWWCHFFQKLWNLTFFSCDDWTECLFVGSQPASGWNTNNTSWSTFTAWDNFWIVCINQHFSWP